ncbi:CYP749A22 protein [Hibiscus syriacus]|uniref:CYP749A22 protein n=1 Tax=Hibiscus syriacus TaxID=106335 RepID=A0A6A3AEM1_HIBSY|nr:CYP749A22 protein [Hibiscus syriacus]
MSALMKLVVLVPCAFFLIALINFLYDYLWRPPRIQNMLNSQGIKGPPYRFIHGNNKEVTSMRKEALSKSMGSTDEIFPRVQPHIYSWINRYGKNYLCWNGNRAELVISEPELVKEVMRNSEKAFPKAKPSFYVSKLFGNGLVFIEGEKWVKHRKLSNNAFHGESLKLWKSADLLESEKLAKEIQDCVMKIVKKREDKVVNGEADSFGNDFLGLLVKAYQDLNEKKKLSWEDLVDECKTFYFAGQETVNSLLAWTVLLLAIHGDWQERQEESPPNGLVRGVEREVQLGKVVLPANIDLLVPNIALHHDPHFWGDDVHLFKPERFAEGIAKATKCNAAAYFPFGLGPRSCVGMTFATTETKIALSMILQHYAITLSPAYVHSPMPIITLQPQHGIQVILESLHNNDA